MCSNLITSEKLLWIPWKYYKGFCNWNQINECNPTLQETMERHHYVTVCWQNTSFTLRSTLIEERRRKFYTKLIQQKRYKEQTGIVKSLQSGQSVLVKIFSERFPRWARLHGRLVADGHELSERKRILSAELTKIMQSGRQPWSQSPMLLLTCAHKHTLLQCCCILWLRHNVLAVLCDVVLFMKKLLTY